MFFTLNSWQLALVLAGILFGATILGLLVGRSIRRHSESLREPLGVVQAALLTLVALILAFGLAMAVTRYEARRAAVVDDANAIGTAYLRAQTLHEPVRSSSLPLYVQYTDASLRLSHSVPGQAAAKSCDRIRVGVAATPLAPGRAGAQLATDAIRTPPVRGKPQRDDRHADDACVCAEQPRPVCDRPRASHRGRARARSAGALPRDPFARCRGGTSCRRPAHIASLRHLRPRSTFTRIHQNPGGAAHRASSIDGAPSGR